MLIRIKERFSDCRTAEVVVIALLIAATGCAGALGTGGGAARAADFAGTWEGSIHMMESSGIATLVLTKSGDTYEGQATIDLEGMRDTSSISRTSFEGNTCSFWMTFEAFGVDVLARGSIEEGILKGVCEAYVEGELTDEGSFALNKKL